MVSVTEKEVKTWIEVAAVSAWPTDGGMAVKHNGEEYAIYNFSTRGEWFATQNLCPHKKQMILARGIIGDKAGEPKVACPYHKKQFSLKSGAPLDDHTCEPLKVFPVKITNEIVYLGITS